LEKLFLYCEKFFDKIIDDDIVAAMPRELRAICYFIELAGEQFKVFFENFLTFFFSWTRINLFIH
jgi:hypothetical protein